MIRDVVKPCLVFSLFGMGLLGSAAGSVADEPSSAQLDAKSRWFLITGQEPAEPFVPLQPRTIEDTNRLEAIKHFCVACKYENEFRWNDAIEAYRRALAHDPKSLAVYRAIIRACQLARRKQDALAYMRQAEDLAPEDYDLLNSLGDSLAEDGQFEGAADYYKRSLASPKLEARHPAVVLLKLKLGMISEQMRQIDKAAGYYADVMTAMENPNEFRLHSLESPPPFLRNKAETYERFSNVFRQAKRFDDALHALKLAQASQPRSTVFSRNIAEIYIDQERYAEALEYLERYLAEQTPQGSQAYERLAFVLTKVGRADEVLPRVQAAAERDRFNAGLQAFLGNLYEEAGDVARAKEIYLSLLKSSSDSRVYKSLARIYHKENQLRELVLLVGDGLEKAMENRGFVLEALPEQLSILTSDPELAKNAVEVARQIYQEDPKQLKFGSRLFTAWIARGARMFDSAIDFYQYSIDLRPQLPRLHREQAIALELAGRTEQAIQSAQRAIDLDSEDADNHEALGQVLVSAGRYERAIEVYQGIIQDFADNAEVLRDARYSLSNVYYQMGDMASAEKTLEEILRQFPDDAPANNDLGYFWADQGRNLEQAEKMIRKAIERYAIERKPWQPEKNAAYLDSLGWVLFKLGKYEDARKFLEEAAVEREGEEDSTIVDHLGDVYMRLKEPAKAKASWLKAKETLEKATGPRRDEKKLKEIIEKLSSLADPKSNRSETKRER